MKTGKKVIIGNWKSNKTSNDVNLWFTEFNKIYQKNKSDKYSNVEIVVCTPFPYLAQASNLALKYKLPLKIGAQDVSAYATGAYTGAVNALQIAEYARYVLIGHSERRKYFNETDADLTAKVNMALKYNLIPVYCVPDANTYIPETIEIAAYEPVWAIGSGKSEEPAKADEVAIKIREINKVNTVIYGGSVTGDNAAAYLKTGNINGILPGGASLNPTNFWGIISNAV